jgi:hypothetical protein
MTVPSEVPYTNGNLRRPHLRGGPQGRGGKEASVARAVPISSVARKAMPSARAVRRSRIVFSILVLVKFHAHEKPGLHSIVSHAPLRSACGNDGSLSVAHGPSRYRMRARYSYRTSANAFLNSSQVLLLLERLLAQSVFFKPPSRIPKPSES